MSEYDDLIFPYKAMVRRVTDGTRQADLLAILQAGGALDPAIFDERAPFFWSAEISNNQVDAMFTHMLPSTLSNFAADARAGVSFINSHRHNELPFGRSLAGSVVENGQRQRAIADFYTLPGLTLNGISTDELIAGMRSGIVADVSVGFHGGKMFCDVCRANYLSWDCPHITGMQYDVKDAGLVTATVSIDGARLSEVSAVYDGATPDAAIIKAQRMADAGELKPEAVRILEARYRMKFETKRSYPGASPGKEKTMNEFEQLVNQIREALGVDAKADLVKAVVDLQATGNDDETRAQLAGLEERAAKAEATVAELTPLAADGKQYRTDLVADALAEGVRAMGDKFDAETYGAILQTAPLTTIKRMRDDWRLTGDGRFQPGRQSQDKGDEAPKQPTAKRSEPAGLYKV